MANIIVEPEKNGGFAALKNGKVVVRGETQKEAADRAHDRRPQDTIEAARVRTTGEGIPDEFRKLHGPKRK
jgi:hypothetical protein